MTADRAQVPADVRFASGPITSISWQSPGLKPRALSASAAMAVEPVDGGSGAGAAGGGGGAAAVSASGAPGVVHGAAAGAFGSGELVSRRAWNARLGVVPFQALESG